MSGEDRSLAFLEDVLAGPRELGAVLEAQREALGDIPLGALSRPTLRFVGMGSSRFAAMDAASRLRALGRDAHAEIASSSSFSTGGRDTLVVAISASGRTPEVLDAAERHRGTSFVLGLTARPDSPLARHADAVVPLAADSRETAGIACLTYRATVSALIGLTGDGGTELVPQRLAGAALELEALLAERLSWVDRAADVFEGARAVHVLADGGRLGAAEQASLMFREAPRLTATAFDTGDWLHVGLYTLFPGDAVLLFGGAAADDAALRTIRDRGGRVVTVGPVRSEVAADVAIPLPGAAATNRVVCALVESAVAELVAAELWRRTNARQVGQEGAPA